MATSAHPTPKMPLPMRACCQRWQSPSVNVHPCAQMNLTNIIHFARYLAGQSGGCCSAGWGGGRVCIGDSLIHDVLRLNTGEKSPSICKCRVARCRTRLIKARCGYMVSTESLTKAAGWAWQRPPDYLHAPRMESAP